MMFPADFFKVAALKLEQHYAGVDNLELLTLFDTSSTDSFDAQEIESLLVSYIEDNLGNTEDNLSTALFALGKTYKKKYRPLYISAMERNIELNLGICYQAGIAIENLGENIFFSISPSEDPKASYERANEFLSANGK
jgi:hypothetical protein